MSKNKPSKKNNNCIKSVLKTTLQHFNYTEELRIPTTNDMDYINKSIDMNYNMRKPSTQKIRSQSAKQQNKRQEISFGQIIRKIKMMKLSHEQSNSIIKKQSKSKKNTISKKRKNNTLPTKLNSSESYANRLDLLKIKELNKIKFIEDEQELDLVFPQKCSEDAYSIKLLQSFRTDKDDIIDIDQINYFSRTNINFKNQIKHKSINQLNHLTLMAIRIQTAWRQYKTNKLVSHYTNTPSQFTNNRKIQSQNIIQNYNKLSQTELKKRKKAAQLIKQAQIQKWDSVINMVKSQMNNPQSNKQFFAELQKEITKNANQLKGFLSRPKKSQQFNISLNLKKKKLKTSTLSDQQSLHSYNEYNSQKYQNIKINKKQQLQQSVKNQIKNSQLQRQSECDNNQKISKENIQEFHQDQLIKHQNYKDLIQEEKNVKSLEGYQQYFENEVETQTFPHLQRSEKQCLNGKQSLNNQNSQSSISEQYIDERLQKDMNELKKSRIGIILFNYLLIQAFGDIVRNSNFIEIISAKFKRKKEETNLIKRGFRTNHLQVDRYIDKMIKILIADNQKFVVNLQKPKGPTALQILKYARSTDEIYSEQQDENQSLFVVPNKIFQILWQQTQSQLQKHFQKEQNFKMKIQYISYLYQTFHRSIFDAFNQCLQLERNFGSFGKQFPWKNSPKFDHIISQISFKSKLQRSRKKLNFYSSCYCGIIYDSDSIAQLEDSEAYLEEVKQERLTRMLMEEIRQEDSKWLFYDDEEVETYIELADQLQDSLIIELWRQIFFL